MSEPASSGGMEIPGATPRAGGEVRSAAVAFIFVTILLDMFALGLIMPILPKLVESFVNNDTASAARIFGLFGTAWAAMQFSFRRSSARCRIASAGGRSCCCRILGSRSIMS